MNRSNALLLIVVLFGSLLGSCALAPLDRTGAIRPSSDSDAGCPNGFVVRWGRCCPADSSPQMCPTMLERDPTGVLFPPLDCGCPTEFEQRGNVCCRSGGATCTGANRHQLTGCVCPATYELRFNTCCPAESGPECPPGVLGSPCGANEDCHLPIGANGLLVPYCLQPSMTSVLQLPDGYCSVLNCSTSMDCGPDGTCLHTLLDRNNPMSLLGYCMRGCTNPSATETYLACPGTNNEYACYVAPDSTGRVSACLPDCVMSPSVCATPAVCAQELHYCVLPCHSALDDVTCRLSGYARCNVNAQRCQL